MQHRDNNADPSREHDDLSMNQATEYDERLLDELDAELLDEADLLSVEEVFGPVKSWLRENARISH